MRELNEHIILEQVVNYARKLIGNQAMYQLSTPALEERWDEWICKIDSITPAQYDELHALVLQHPLCDYDAVVELVADMTIEELFDDDNWVDPIADYIATRNHECEDIVRAMIARTGWE
jgi:hypothetical protein